MALAPLVFSILIAAGIMSISVGLAKGRKHVSMGDRLVRFAERPKTLEQLELERPFKERIAKPFVFGIARAFSRLAPQQRVEKTRISLLLAGSPGNMRVTEFIGMQVLLALVLGATLFIIFWLGKMSPFRVIAFSGAAAAGGYIMPVLWLRSKIKARKKAIFRQLPDAIDLLTISVDAGLAFDSALQRVSEKWDNELSLEFRRVIAEIRMGVPRRDALRDLATRTGVSELSTFVASIIQADQLGVSISRVLQVQADQMRIRRRQWAEAEAHRAPLKMMFPIAFFIFPALYVIILGPVVPGIAEVFFKK